MTAATWGQVHIGDAVRGADQRAWRVIARERGARWLGAGTAEDKFTLVRDEREVVARRALLSPVDIVELAEHADLAAAAAALVQSGMTIEILKEGTVSDAELTDHPSGVCAHPAEAISPTPTGGRVCTECFAQLPAEAVVECGHPFNKRSVLKSGTACKTFLTEDVQGASQAETPAPDGSTAGGAMLTGASAAGKPDPFTPAEAPKRREAPRGQWGWYKLPHPVTGAADALFPRVTTIVKALDDGFGLNQWKMRMVAKGVAMRPDLAASAAAADVEVDKSRLDDIVRSAMEKAEASAAANYGTALHKFCERLDAGESVKTMGVPAMLVGDVEAYARTLKEHGLTVLPEYSERTVVHPDMEYAGTLDRIVVDRAGQRYVLDLKSGKDLSYSWLEFTAQQAAYAHAPFMCTPDYLGYEVLAAPPDKMKALIMHLPIGTGRGQIYGVPLDKGWQALRAAIAVRRMRTDAKSWNWLVQPESPADVVRLHLDRAEEIHVLQDIATNAKSRGLWTPDLEAHALGRYDLIRAMTADGQPALAALWNELEPAGRWTEAVDAAAQARLAQIQQQPAMAA